MIHFILLSQVILPTPGKKGTAGPLKFLNKLYPVSEFLTDDGQLQSRYVKSMKILPIHIKL